MCGWVQAFHPACPTSSSHSWKVYLHLPVQIKLCVCVCVCPCLYLCLDFSRFHTHAHSSATQHSQANCHGMFCVFSPQGFVVGNPVTDRAIMGNGIIYFAWARGLFSSQKVFVSFFLKNSTEQVTSKLRCSIVVHAKKVCPVSHLFSRQWNRLVAECCVNGNTSDCEFYENTTPECTREVRSLVSKSQQNCHSYCTPSLPL